MGTSTLKDKPRATRRAIAHATALPPPYQLAIEAAEFQLTIFDEQGAAMRRGDPTGLAGEAEGKASRGVDDCETRDRDRDSAVMPATWFSVALTAPSKKRYLYLVQHELDTGLIVLLLLFDRSARDAPGAPESNDALRLPPSGAWLRAVVDGTIHVLASDLVLSRKAITAWLGGDDPPTTPARPPYT